MHLWIYTHPGDLGPLTPGRQILSVQEDSQEALSNQPGAATRVWKPRESWLCGSPACSWQLAGASDVTGAHLGRSELRRGPTFRGRAGTGPAPRPPPPPSLFHSRRPSRLSHHFLCKANYLLEANTAAAERGRRGLDRQRAQGPACQVVASPKPRFCGPLKAHASPTGRRCFRRLRGAVLSSRPGGTRPARQDISKRPTG